MEYNLYGLKKGENKPYMEDLILNSRDLKEIEKAKEKAIKKGFHNLRISKINMNIKPDFIGALNIKPMGALK